MRERECEYLPCLINTTDVSLIQQMSHKYNSSINATDVVQMQQLVVKIQQRYFVSLIPHKCCKDTTNVEEIQQVS